jgi:hypothetical protein
LRIDEQIQIIDKAICRHIDQFDASGRGAVSQDILKNLRDFVEHIMLKVYAQGKDIDDNWDTIQAATKYVKSRAEWKDLTRFHNYLQISVSHYTVDEENSERLMLKYYVFLLKLKKALKEKFSLDVLANLDRFPLNTDITLQEYYDTIDHCRGIQQRLCGRQKRRICLRYGYSQAAKRRDGLLSAILSYSCHGAGRERVRAWHCERI